MATERKMEPKLAEAAAKTTAVLETLRSRLSRETTVQQPAVVAPPEDLDELDRELAQYFAAGSLASSPTEQPKPASGDAEIRIPLEIRAQVIDGVVDKILRSWGAPNGEIPAGIKSEVVGRLVEHVLGELLKKGARPR
jgi:hypothetical protein